MLRILSIFICVLVASGVFGAENLFRNPMFLDGGREWQVEGKGANVRFADGGVTFDIRNSNDASRHKLQQIMPLKRGATYRMYCSLECREPQSRMLTISYRKLHKPENLGVFRRFPVTRGKQLISFDFVPARESEDPDDPPVLSFYLGDIAGEFTIRDLLLVDCSNLGKEPLPFSDTWYAFARIPESFRPGAGIPKELTDGNGRKCSARKIQRSRLLSRDGKVLTFDLESFFGRRNFRDIAVLYNEFESDRDQLIPVGFSADWWMEITLNGKLVYTTMKTGNEKKTFRPNDHVAFLPVHKGKNTLAVRVQAGSEKWLLVCGVPEPPEPPKRFTAREGYLPTDLSCSVIQPGSALDLSTLTDAPAGKYGQARLLPDGTIGFAKKPETVRFFGFSSGIPENVWKNCSDAEFEKNAPAYAKAVRAQGYNFVRFHGIDQWLMAHSTRDLTPLPKIRDRWDRLIAEFKKEGIYVQLNLLAFWLGSSEKEWFTIAEGRTMHKNMFTLGRTWERERFRKVAEMLLNHTNPYTGLKWKDDPVFLSVEFYNELGLAIPGAEKMKREHPDAYKFFMEKWKEFLKNKYADATDAQLPYELRKGRKPYRGLENPPIPVSWAISQLQNDYDEFWYENLKQSYKFCNSVVRDLGWKGIVVNCPMPAAREAVVTWESDIVPDGHGYHCHPWNGEQPGSRVESYSSVAQEASVFRQMHGKRVYGRPFFCNEFNYVFPNPYQYESPVAFAAYAALNNWSTIATHTPAVYLKIPKNMALHSFDTGNNPVLRAGEYLASLFFRRGDVKSAPHRIAIMSSKKEVFSPGRSSSVVAPVLSRLTLLTDASVMFSDIQPAPTMPKLPRPDWVVSSSKDQAGMSWHEWYAEMKDTPTNTSALEAAIAVMRRKGWLPAGNLTDVAKGIYQSETGEITLFSKEKKLTVITPRSEAVALPGNSSAKLDKLEVRKTGVNALIALASVEKVPLNKAKRMVLICSTRPANTGMERTLDDELLRINGTTPVLLQSGKFELAVRHPDKLRCFALRLDGKRMEEIPTNTDNGGTVIALDTATLKNGPTPFFELTAE